MKKFLAILILTFFILVCSTYLISKRNTTKKFITFDEFLYDNSKTKWTYTKFNTNNNLEYNNKIILNSAKKPLNKNTINNTIELKIMLSAEGIEPEPECNLYDSGTIGCYDYYLYEGKEKNYWKNPNKIKNVITYKKPYDKNKFITFYDFIKDRTDNKFVKLNFNKNGELLLEKKIVLNNRGQAVNNKYEYSTPEFNAIISLGNVYPEPNCFEKEQQDKELGCFYYYIKDGKEKNYWEKSPNN